MVRSADVKKRPRPSAARSDPSAPPRQPTYQERAAEVAVLMQHDRERSVARAKRSHARRKAIKSVFALAVVAALGIVAWQVRSAIESRSAVSAADRALPGFVETTDFTFTMPARPEIAHAEGNFAGRHTIATTWTVGTEVASLQVTATDYGNTLHADLAQIAFSNMIDALASRVGGVLAQEEQFKIDGGTARRAVIDVGGGRSVLVEAYSHGSWIVLISSSVAAAGQPPADYLAVIDSLTFF